jgi:hypothetical protein
MPLDASYSERVRFIHIKKKLKIEHGNKLSGKLKSSSILGIDN